jgi:predicted transcriptional regulator
MGGARTKSVTVRLDLGVNDRLDNYCGDAGLSKSLVVNCTLAHFLGTNEKARLDIVKDYIKRAKRKR